MCLCLENENDILLPCRVVGKCKLSTFHHDSKLWHLLFFCIELIERLTIGRKKCPVGKNFYLNCSQKFTFEGPGITYRE